MECELELAIISFIVCASYRFIDRILRNVHIQSEMYVPPTLLLEPLQAGIHKKYSGTNRLFSEIAQYVQIGSSPGGRDT